MTMLDILSPLRGRFLQLDAYAQAQVCSVLHSTLNANISEAVKNLVDLDLQALFAKWMEGLYSIVLLAALGFPFILFKYLSKEKTQ